MLQHLLQYAETDLLCYRMPVDVQYGLNDTDLPWSKKLRAVQDASFDPILVWAAVEYGIALHCTEGVMPIAQPEASLQKIAAAFEQSSDHQLAALSLLVPILGSVMLALAVWKKCCTIDAALIAAHLDEDVAAERYGIDAETEAKWALKCADAQAAAVWLFSA